MDSKKPLLQPATKPIVYLFAILGGFAGLLYGYDSGAISLALPSITTAFGLNSAEKGLVVSFLLFGALPSIVVFTAMEKKIERRNVLILGGFIFIGGSIFSALSADTMMLMVARFILGVAAGIANMYGLIYLSELAPAHIRGLMSSLYQLSVNIGILMAYAVGAYNLPADNWRWTLGLGAIPAAVFAVGMILSPQSPRWLIRDNQVEKARRVLKRVRITDDEIESEITDIQDSLKSQEAGLRELFGTFRPVMILLFVLTFFQVFTGINAAVYYAPEIFHNLGMANASILADFAVGGALVVSTFLSLPFIDRLGRKKLLEISLGGQVPPAIALCIWSDNATIAIVAIFVYVFAFGFGLGPVFWSYVPEILPLKARALGMGVITFTQYLFNGILSLIFPMLLEALGINVFYIFAALSALAVFYIHKNVLETKGRKLEDIEHYWETKQV
ncbi:sugar porter family MFS transporter [Lacticaseibacillus rhamnosus]|uniref:sugar porter family MFS transporter n=1 Tax=Lacticaseibacillus rhamnosus TaxID=47715 RepID=UPI0022EBEDF8|nr:sugar porter family MFS transporter [Lacticaseibacillus rhamnosus]MDA3726784.1 sugar porter family MFS transporter [Lacticaseibacillus rhamnosus]MDA3737827.1 sugar porter family MFS transporter [Lacticaseibacillus rhamnosus]MDA3743074.1 sugar porter family MFS transporter [Lacticaseibacillus rhamnosus]MDA3745679.1 sugar porter family MFS transporter [Lacticaseibacillus rhamnosus]MDA3751252.1 sugar porter family MFS transporter [Lacticaseibacillus rhamnosus]